MKCNTETSMEPRLQEAIQEKLDALNLHSQTRQTKQICIATCLQVQSPVHCTILISYPAHSAFEILRGIASALCRAATDW